MCWPIGLWKLKVSKAGAVSGESYTTGAMLGHDVGETEAPKLDVVVEDLNASTDCEGFVVQEVFDGDEMVVCAIPISKNNE